MKHTPAARRRYVVVALIGAGLLVPAVAAAHIPEVLIQRPLPLQLRLLQAGELLDFVPVGNPQLVLAGHSISQTEAAGYPALPVTRVGLVVALSERLSSPTTPEQALSTVAEFVSSRAAHHQLAIWREQGEMNILGTGVPGLVTSRTRRALALAFADGNYVYRISEYGIATAKGQPSMPRLVAAATSLYCRVHAQPTSYGPDGPAHCGLRFA